MRKLIALAIVTLAPTAVAQTAKPTDTRTRFKQNAAAAVTAERSREKLNLCRNPKDAVEQITCPDDEFNRSSKNYLQLARAVGGLLRLYVEGSPSAPTAQDRSDANNIGKDFDAAEVTWAKYRDAQCVTVSDDQYPGATNGHPWAYAEAACKLAVTRHHIYELNDVYSWLWTR